MELTPNTIYRNNNFCVITFYVVNSFKIQYPYDSIGEFHLAVEYMIRSNRIDVSDIAEIIYDLNKMEEKAHTWTQNEDNLKEYNSIDSTGAQDEVIRKIFEPETVLTISKRWQFCIIILMYYNKTINFSLSRADKRTF